MLPICLNESSKSQGDFDIRFSFPEKPHLRPYEIEAG